MSKRLLKAGLAVSLLAMAGCNGQSAQAKKTGTYYGEAQGFGGIVSAYVTLDNGTITDVKLQGLDETVGKGSVVIEQFPEQIVEKNSIEIDALTGATVTSNAIKAAVQAALESNETVEYTAPEVKIAFTPGTYTGKGFGHNDFTTVKVTFSEDAITDVKVTEDKSTDAMRNATVETIRKES